jgi:hypothetical protein
VGSRGLREIARLATTRRDAAGPSSKDRVRGALQTAQRALLKVAFNL